MTLFHTCCETLHSSGGGVENEGELEEDSSGGGWLATRLAVDLSPRLGGTHVCPPQPWREIDAHVYRDAFELWTI